MNADELTARAARWCEAAGIPPPDDVEEDDTRDGRERGVSMSWWLPGDNDFDAECYPTGEFRWESWWRWEDYGYEETSSASLIAAIKEATA